MKLLSFLSLITCMFSLHGFSQNVTIEGLASDSTKGFNVIEIVINDTLSKVMKDPKAGRPKYLKMYQNPRFVVRTDSTGRFRIKASPNDTLFFKSYQHKTVAISVRDLTSRPTVKIVLVREEVKQ